jgi:hypothetical protein
MSATALIPHPTAYWGALTIELVDESRARRLAAAYDNGCYRAIERIFRLGDRHDWEAANLLHRRFAPSYAELRDFLMGECDVPLVLAARIALHMTRWKVVS